MNRPKARKPKKLDWILAFLLAGIALTTGYLLVSGWRSATIIADTSKPVFDEVKTTCGYVVWRPGGLSFMGQTGLPVTAYIRENTGLKYVKVELVEPKFIPLVGWAYDTIQEIELKPLEEPETALIPGFISPFTGGGGGSEPADVEDWPLYVYGGVFTSDKIDANKEYVLVYIAEDIAGNKAEWQTRITPVVVAGYVTVNGEKVGVSDEIVVRTLKLDIRFYAEDPKAVKRVYGKIDGETFELEYQQPMLQESYWQYVYTLPGDGRYDFIIYVVDKAGNEVRFASFTVEAGVPGIKVDQTTLLYTFIGVIGLAVAGFLYMRWSRKRRR